MSTTKNVIYFKTASKALAVAERDVPCSPYLRAGRLSLLLPPPRTCSSSRPLQARPGSPQSNPRTPDSNYQPSPHHGTGVPAEVSPRSRPTDGLALPLPFQTLYIPDKNKRSAVNEYRKGDAKACGKRSSVHLP